MKACYGIVGAGGYGREVMPLARTLLSEEIQAGQADIVFVVEGEIGQSTINGHRVISLSEFKALTVEKRFNIAIGDSMVRERIANDCISSGMASFQIIAHNTVILDENVIGEGCVFSPFTTVTSNARIGAFFHANIYSYVAHDCVIGNYVTFAPNVHCNGHVIVEDHAYIGAGAVIKPGTKEKPIVIGRNSIVGMGAIVNKSVSPFTTVFGNPARQIGLRNDTA